jgi:hypothetical protein
MKDEVTAVSIHFILHPSAFILPLTPRDARGYHPRKFCASISRPIPKPESQP